MSTRIEPGGLVDGRLNFIANATYRVGCAMWLLLLTYDHDYMGVKEPARGLLRGEFGVWCFAHLTY